VRFPLLSSLSLPCVFEELVPGKLHPDGRRYLPLIVLRPSQAPAGGVTPAGLRLGVVDRHHRVDEAYVGRAGVARLVCALSALRLQGQPHRAGLQPEAGWAAGRPSSAPTIYGRVGEVAAWEEGGGQLPYQTLYAELSIDIGLGTVGLRTSVTADDMAAAIGAARVRPGDWVELRRSRIDILAFSPL
jgi:hypothetical protein